MHIAPDNIEKATGTLFECHTVQQDKVVSPNHLFYKGQIIYSKIRPLLRKAVIAPFDGLCSAELDETMALAKEKGLVMAEAMTIYHMPLYKKLREILDAGTLGKVNLLTMNFGSFKEYDENNRFFNRNLAGGAMLDIGVYALSFVRWFLDSKPDQLLSQVRTASTGVDEQSGLLLTNQEGQMATVMLSLHSKQPKRGMISCERGYIEIMEYPRAGKAKVTYTDTGKTEIIEAGDNADALYYEVLDMEHAITSGDVSAMQLSFSKDVMDLMTAFRKKWGVSYPEEER